MSAHPMFVESIDATLGNRVRSIVAHVQRGEFDLAVGVSMATHDLLQQFLREGTLGKIEFYYRATMFAFDLSRALGMRCHGMLLLAEADARAERGDGVFPRRDQLADAVRKRMPLC